MFTAKKNGALLLQTMYVDDILICVVDMNMLKNLKQQFTQSFEMKDLGKVNQYLGMTLKQKMER